MLKPENAKKNVAMLLMDPDFRRATIKRDKFIIDQFRKDFGGDGSQFPPEMKTVAEILYIASLLNEFNRSFQTSVSDAEDSFFTRLFDMTAALLRNQVGFVEVEL